MELKNRRLTEKLPITGKNKEYTTTESKHISFFAYKISHTSGLLGFSGEIRVFIFLDL